MKKLFKAIRQENLEEIKSIIEKNPQLVNCVATPPPKKDKGQSPLQVALKISALEIIDYLIEHGADVNFMEEEDGGKKHETVIKGDVDKTAHTRAIMQSYCRERGLI